MPMHTRNLWRALERPPTRNPVFIRAYDAPEQPTLWYIGCAQGFGILFFIPIIAFPAAIYGMGWAAGISNLIAKERAQGTFDLIRLCPSGPLGMTWALCTGYLYHHRTFKNINANSNFYLRVAFLGIMFVGLEVAWLSLSNDPLLIFPLIVRVVTFVAALIVEHQQSLLIASLTGILAPFLTGDRINAQVFAFALYLLAQIAAYVVTVLLGFVILTDLFAVLGVSGWFGESLLLCLRLGIFIGVREVLIRVLWRALGQQLALAPVEQTEFLHRYTSGTGSRR